MPINDGGRLATKATPSYPIICRFGCAVADERFLSLVQYGDGCICFDDPYQWLCPQHTVKGLQNNAGVVVRGYLKDAAS